MIPRRVVWFEFSFRPLSFEQTFGQYLASTKYVLFFSSKFFDQIPLPQCIIYGGCLFQSNRTLGSSLTRLWQRPARGPSQRPVLLRRPGLCWCSVAQHSNPICGPPCLVDSFPHRGTWTAAQTHWCTSVCTCRLLDGFCCTKNLPLQTTRMPEGWPMASPDMERVRKN